MSMARRNNNKMTRMKKPEPSVMTFDFEGTTVPPLGAVADTLDLSQIASIVNRRFYRQGLNWVVAGFKILSTAQAGFVSIHKLPSSWIMSNSWHKSFATWQRMNNEALAESESVRPRFLDFKIYADSTHHDAGFGANLLPRSVAAVVATPGEWESSKIIIPDNTNPGFSTEQEFVAVGTNYPGAGASGLNAVSLIEGYAASRGLPNVLDPNAPDDAADASGPNPQNWMVATFNEGTSQDETVIEDMLLENRIAPYPFENDGVNLDTMYPGGANQLSGLQIHDSDYITGTTIGGTTRLQGGVFPCGLVRFVVLNSDEATPLSWTLQVKMVPGMHRGYLAESMQDM